MIIMDKLYDYIASKYDSSLVEKVYGISLRKYLEYGVDERYIDDINILKMFNDIYLDVKDKFDNFDLEDIKKVSDKYLFLINRIDEYKKIGNYNRDNYVLQHEPFIDEVCINYVRNNSYLFSLNELFSLSNFKETVGGVCLISKKQTVCMYNDDLFGYIGSGYHNDSFHNIIKAIYNEKFDGESVKIYETCQDIRVSFSNNFDGFSQIVRVYVDIPVPINSSQLESLKILNDEIKKFKDESSAIVEESASIINYNDKDFVLEFDNCSDLDKVFEWILVSDSYEPFYEDKNIIGFINGENHFNDGNKNNIKQK